MVIGKKSNFGLSVSRYLTAGAGGCYLHFVFWYPVRWNKELGYKYASVRWF